MVWIISDRLRGTTIKFRTFFSKILLFFIQIQIYPYSPSGLLRYFGPICDVRKTPGEILLHVGSASTVENFLTVDTLPMVLVIRHFMCMLPCKISFSLRCHSRERRVWRVIEEFNRIWLKLLSISKVQNWTLFRSIQTRNFARFGTVFKSMLMWTRFLYVHGPTILNCLLSTQPFLRPCLISFTCTNKQALFYKQ